jgi:tetratricopeptide (TPR) repeat protein
MTLDTRKFVVLPVLILLLMPVVKAADTTKKLQPRADSMSVWQARRNIVAGAKYALVRVSTLHFGRIDRNSIRFTPDSFEFDALNSKNDRQHFKVDLKTLETVSIECDRICYLKNEAGKYLPSPPMHWLYFSENTSQLSAHCPADCVYSAERFGMAVNRLRAFAKDTSSPLPTFTQRAAAWRALAVKPPISEQVREQRLLAENAFKEKKLEESLDHYESGLELDPTWPQGYFNAALIAAELGFYPEAVEQMQAYLELVPDAPDAQSARDQIVIWQYKAKQGAATDIK